MTESDAHISSAKRVDTEAMTASAPRLGRPAVTALVSEMDRRGASAESAIRSFARAIEGRRFVDLEKNELGGVASATCARTDLGLHVVLRSPPDPTESMRLHNMILRLAHQMGMPDLVLPSAIGRHEARTLMVTPHAGDDFSLRRERRRGWLACRSRCASRAR